MNKETVHTIAYFDIDEDDSDNKCVLEDESDANASQIANGITASIFFMTLCFAAYIFIRFLIIKNRCE